MSANIETYQPKRVNKERINQIKEWFGWNDGMINLIKKGGGLKLIYRVMIAEKKENSNVHFVGHFTQEAHQENTTQFNRKEKEREPIEKFNAHNCPNKSNHISAFAAFDRIICPWCKEVFIERKMPEM